MAKFTAPSSVNGMGSSSGRYFAAVDGIVTTPDDVTAQELSELALNGFVVAADESPVSATTTPVKNANAAPSA
jgi:hypothetical protein